MNVVHFTLLFFYTINILFDDTVIHLKNVYLFIAFDILIFIYHDTCSIQCFLRTEHATVVCALRTWCMAYN